MRKRTGEAMPLNSGRDNTSSPVYCFASLDDEDDDSDDEGEDEDGDATTTDIADEDCGDEKFRSSFIRCARLS